MGAVVPGKQRLLGRCFGKCFFELFLLAARGFLGRGNKGRLQLACRCICAVESRMTRLHRRLAEDMMMMVVVVVVV